MSNQQKKSLQKIIIAAIAYIFAEIIGKCATFNVSPYVEIALFMAAYLTVGYAPIKSAFFNIFRGQIFDENFLMTVATVGALCLKQWDEAVAVMLFYSVGSLFEDCAVDKSRESISDLMDIYPEYANLITESGEEKVDPYDLNIGDIILIKPGERVPIDGTVVSGNASLDTSALTGEALPLDVEEGMEIAGGCINIDGVLNLKVTNAFEDSTVAKILDLVENSGAKKAKVEKFITKFARYYTPAVVLAALGLALMAPLFLDQSFSKWLYRALLFLVISCPCALVISVPLAFFGGVGAASRGGVLVKGSSFLEVLSDANTFVMDKTGTLTTGKFQVSHISNESILEIMALCELHSSHPISLSIQAAYTDTENASLDTSRVNLIKEIPGKGVVAEVDGKTYYAGNSRLMEEFNISDYEISFDKTLVHLADEDNYLGFVALEDTLKEDTKKGISELSNIDEPRLILLTGDRKEVAKSISQTIGIREYYAELMPQDKVRIIEDVISQEKNPVVFVGDGINDAPTLARAYVGIAMGGLGSQAAIEAADVVIMNDSPAKIPEVVKISKRTLAIARENVIFALGIKALVLVLGTVGLANMWMAVFADVGVSIIAIINSMRILLKKS